MVKRNQLGFWIVLSTATKSLDENLYVVSDKVFQVFFMNDLVDPNYVVLHNEARSKRIM